MSQGKMEEALLIRERDYFFNLFFTQFLSPISLLVGECFVLNPLSWINLVGYLRAQSLYTSMKGTFRSFRIPHCLVSVHRIHLRVLFMYTGYAVIGFFRFFFFFSLAPFIWCQRASNLEIGFLVRRFWFWRFRIQMTCYTVFSLF